jgi:hypothetical protein
MSWAEDEDDGKIDALVEAERKRAVRESVTTMVKTTGRDRPEAPTK